MGTCLLDRADSRSDGGEIRRVPMRWHEVIIDRPFACHKAPLGHLPFIWLNASPDLGPPGSRGTGPRDLE